MATLCWTKGLPPWLNGKESGCNVGDTGSIPGSGRSPGGGHGNPFQYNCLENPMDRETWWATVHRITESWTTEWARMQARVEQIYWHHFPRAWIFRPVHCFCRQHAIACLIATCMHAKLQSCIWLCNPMDSSQPGSSVHRILQAEYWSGLSFPSPGYLLDPGVKPSAPVAPELLADSLLLNHEGSLIAYSMV